MPKFQLPKNKLLGQLLVVAGITPFFLVDPQWLSALGVLSIILGSLIISKSRSANDQGLTMTASRMKRGPAIAIIAMGVLFAAFPALLVYLSAPTGSDPFAEGQFVLTFELTLFLAGPIGLAIALYGLVKLLKAQRSSQVGK